MVDIQWARDARMAASLARGGPARRRRCSSRAHSHARRDRGVPVHLARQAPGPGSRRARSSRSDPAAIEPGDHAARFASTALRSTTVCVRAEDRRDGRPVREVQAAVAGVDREVIAIKRALRGAGDGRHAGPHHAPLACRGISQEPRRHLAQGARPGPAPDARVPLRPDRLGRVPTAIPTGLARPEAQAHLAAVRAYAKAGRRHGPVRVPRRDPLPPVAAPRLSR